MSTTKPNGLTIALQPAIGSLCERAAIWGNRAITAALAGDVMTAGVRAQWAAHLARRFRGE